MGMSHANCNHPATPAARAKCRKAGGPGPSPDAMEGKIGTMKIVVEPRRGRKPILRDRKPGFIRDEGDLAAEVPHTFSAIIRLAWLQDYVVRHETPFNDQEKRVTITSPRGELALVWRSSNPFGVWGAFWRPAHSSVAHRIQEAPVLSTAWTLVHGNEN